MSKNKKLSKNDKGRWIGNKYLPTKPVLEKKKEKEKFINILIEQKGRISPAALEFGCHPRTVYRYMAADPGFENAIQEVKKEYGLRLLDMLEDVSHEQSLLPGNSAERMFNMKSLDPGKYNPYRNRGDTTTNIVVTTTSPPIDDRLDPYKVIPEEAKDSEKELETQEEENK
jgi:hypothetical protein